jgi:dipeptidase D
MEDRSLQHGPLELLFTVDEETGLTGAKYLSPDFVESRILLNLDSEDEGELYVGCAGGRDTRGAWTVHLSKAPDTMVAVQIKVAGLKGGHSGLEIDKGRGNAIKIINRALMALNAAGARLSSINGGDKHNAIPRECEAVLQLPPRKLKMAKGIVEEFNATAKAEIASVDPDLTVSLITMEQNVEAPIMRKSEQRKILQTIAGIPHGMIKMSADIPDLVETSTNLAVVQTLEDSVKITTSQRSSVASEIVEIADTVAAILQLGGADIESADGYPGWKPDMDSPILKIAKSSYRSLYGKDPEVKAVHAGLECGVIGERIPGMDMVSFGPTLEGVHSPDEKIHIDTVEKFWDFLLEILKNV